MSLIESVVGVAFGYVIAVATAGIVLPAYGFPITLSENLSISAIFTAISVARSYVFRRVFNWWHCRGAQWATTGKEKSER